MKILLQDRESGLYLGRGGCWISNPANALAFLNEERAKDFSIYHRLPNAEVVFRAKPGASQVPLTTVAGATKTNYNTQPFMNAQMNTQAKTTQAAKRTQRKGSKPISARATSAADQMTAVLEQPARHEPAQTEVPLSRQGFPVEQVTVVEAKIDVGLGNTLFIRGQGDGLSWLKGVPLNCVDANTWVWSNTQATDKVVFKLLLNDEVWAKGEDVVAEVRRKIETVPFF
jgi:hypothetical protein